MMKISELAAEARRHFTKDTRNDGKTFWKHDVDSDDEKDGWIYDLAREAHGDMSPDDYRYAFVVEALDAIADSDAEDADDLDGFELESDIYTSDLTAWLGSRGDRLDFCDRYADETDTKDTLQRISGGQWLEKSEVMASVRSSLAAELENRNNDAESAT